MKTLLTLCFVGVTLASAPVYSQRCEFQGKTDAEAIDLLAKMIQDGGGEKGFNSSDFVSFIETEDGLDPAKFASSDFGCNTWSGDSTLDGEFNSGDLIQIFAAGRYETGQSADWGQGDWNGDGVFNSSDLIRAFSGGGYETGIREAVAAVPEPATASLLILGILGLATRRRRSN